MKNIENIFKKFIKIQKQEIDKHIWIEYEKRNHNIRDNENELNECIIKWIQEYAAQLREQWLKNNNRK